MMSKLFLVQMFRKYQPQIDIFFISLFISGLVAAKEFGEIFSELRKGIYIVSSVYFASRQVCPSSKVYLSTNGWVGDSDSENKSFIVHSNIYFTQTKV